MRGIFLVLGIRLRYSGDQRLLFHIFLDGSSVSSIFTRKAFFLLKFATNALYLGKVTARSCRQL